MKLITRQTLANELPAYLAARHSDLHDGYRQWHLYTEPYEMCYNKILALGENPDPNLVDSIMGSTSWTTVKCDGCGDVTDTAVLVATSDEYIEIHLCLDCLKIATEIGETAR